MPAYEFTALDSRGRQEKGLLEGDTPRQVRGMLRDRGLTPLDVHEVAEQATRRAGGLFARGGWSHTELTLFTRQLATLARSGLPLDEALAAVGQQTERKNVKRVVLGVRSGVVEGNTLALALGQFPSVFPPLFRATVEAGESSGKLDNVLERLADYVERRQALQQKMMIAAIYPAILTFVALAVVSLLLTYVVPKVVAVFADMDAKLPFMTRALIALSDFLRDYGIGILVALVVGAIVFANAMKSDDFKRKVHRAVLELPLVGRLTRGSNTGRFTRTLGILFGAGVPILDAMRIGTQVVGNLPMREAIEAATLRVREGAPVNRSLAESGLFPPITLHLIASGEASGRLDDMLDRAAEQQEREVETLVAAMMGLLEPILIVTMGAIVFAIVMAILLPIFDLNQLVK
ncbi:MAG TPA: type II secretion system inner membrane protein GspF [Verrucomicrobiae bacterium]|nr:type II secretion system inner membrane protein GspF [Verrucomicrobiae bacterium]